MLDGPRDTGRSGSSQRRDKPRGRSSARADRKKTTGTRGTNARGDVGQVNEREARGRGKQRGKKSRRKHAGRRAGEKHRNDAAMGALRATLEKDLGMVKETKKDRRHKVMRGLLDRKLERWKKEGISSFEIEKWHEEMLEIDEARMACSKIAAMEDEQFRKREAKFMAPALGNIGYEPTEGCWRFMSLQVNSMSGKGVREVKIAQTTTLANRYGVDLMALTEHGINHGQLAPSQTLASFFEADVEMRSVSAFNKTENPFSEWMPGGAAIVATNTVLPYAGKSGVDWRGLGRWAWYVLEAEGGHRTRVVSVYNIGGHKSDGLSTVYQQHLRYLQLNNMLDTTPRELMKRDLIKQLKTWVDQGDRIVLTMDANEHVLRGPLCKALVDPENGLKMREVSHEAWGKTPPNTYIDGTDPIDGIWASDTLEVMGVKILPFYSSVGDHRTMVFDITTRSLIGKFEKKIVRSGCRRLTTTNEASLAKYTAIVEQQMARHKM